MMAMPFIRQHGATLVELVISIVVITIAVTGVLLVMQRTSQSSADPMVRHQAVAVAEAYLDEILSKAFEDPSGGETGTAEEASRADFDDVQDYNGLPDNVVRDQNGNSISGLGAYSVTVTASGTALGPGASPAPAADSMRVTVTVAHVSGFNIQVSGYRTKY
jgi:MSHA pilin protein MshD